MTISDKPLTRDVLVSMQVIDSKGKLVGKVKDVAFVVGKTGVSLAVETEDGETKTVEWESVQAASDFVILKPESQSYKAQEMQTEVVTSKQKSSQRSAPLCPTCGKPLTWIPQYKRWYCYNDKKYV